MPSDEDYMIMAVARGHIPEDGWDKYVDDNDTREWISQKIRTAVEVKLAGKEKTDVL